MDFMKVIDQTVRDIKREVNLKVLKVPEIEQKVLDATDDEPWGPHGTALAEIAQATKKFSECQMVMNVLWARLTETGKNWRFVYKALAVIEYLVAHGSERAVDDIVEHTFQISSLASFEYVEPSGKDVGLNVRKKAETIVAILNDKDKVQEVRNKAAVNRDKYFGLSSTGITYKSGSASFSSSSFQSGDRYGGFGSTKDGDSSRDSYSNNRDRYDEDKFEQSTSVKSRRDSESSQGNTSRKGSSRHGSSKVQATKSADVLRTTKNTDEHDKYASIPVQISSPLTNNYDDEFDDFDPRGTSSAKPATGTSHQVDLFGQDLLGDFIDAPIPASSEKSATKADQSEVDLFADATFVSATSPTEAIGSSGDQKSVDLFASQPAPSSAVSSTVDFFAAPDPVTQSDAKSTNQITNSVVDPFAAVPLNNFDASDPFGAFAQNPANDSSPSSLNGPPLDKPGSQSNLNGSSDDTKPPPKKGGFQVKSGIWADSLSRGIIDLNIAAPKKVNLADVGIVGLNDGSEEKEKGPPTSFYMGKAMGSGSGLGKSGFPSASSDGDDFFSSLSSQQYQFGGFKK